MSMVPMQIKVSYICDTYICSFKSTDVRMMPVSMQVHIHHRNVDIQFSADDAFLECLSQFPVEHIKCINTVKVASY
jgi:hypothetical protein